VGVGKINVEIGVAVGSGVKVFLGVAVGVGVKVTVGNAANVCMAAASAVCWISILMSFEFNVGTGTGVAGTQARIRTRAVNQIKNVLDWNRAVSLLDVLINARSL